jgi:putative transposase
MKMERSRRRVFDDPGHAHELTFSCYKRYPFLKAERTCRWLADAIGQARAKLGFALWSYVFMPDHVHLIVHPGSQSCGISSLLRAIKEPVGRKAAQFLVRHAPEWLPRVTQRRGDREERHFWQPGGGYDRNIVEPKTLMSMIDYIHLNPVRKGLVERATLWYWSSAAWFDGSRESPLIPDPIPTGWTDV